MKKSALFTALLFGALILGCNISQAAPPPGGPGGGHMGKPPAHGAMHGHRPPSPPKMHRPPMNHGHYGYHRGHHLRRNVIYANYGWGYPSVGWGVNPYHQVYYPVVPHVNVGFGFSL